AATRDEDALSHATRRLLATDSRGPGRDGAEQSQQRQRVDPRAAGAYGPMQMRSCHAAGRADPPDDLARHDVLVFTHLELGQVSERRVQAEAVVDHDGIAREIQI